MTLPTRKYNKNFFRDLTPDTCYWGGFIAADGSVSIQYNSVSVTLAEKDKAHLESLKTAIDYDGKLLYSKSTKSWALQLYSAEQWLYDLENMFNIVPNKSLILKPPTQLVHPTRLFEKAFLVGLIDGDGCIRYDKRDALLILDVFSGSLRMVKWAKELIESEYQLPDKAIFSRPNAHLYRLIGKQAEKLRAELSTICEHKLERKWCPVKPPKVHRDRRKLRTK